jgi:hypothetical protein
LSRETLILYGKSVCHNLRVLNRPDVQSAIINHIRTEINVLFKDPVRTFAISVTKTDQLMLSVF